MSAAAAANWSDLHPDLLSNILLRLDIASSILFSSVCVSFHRCFQDYYRHLGKKPQIPWLITAQIPWFMLSSSQTQTRHLYSFSSDHMRRRIHLPQLSGRRRFLGSSHGFIFTLNELAEISATNPLTLSNIPIPSTLTLPTIVQVYSDYQYEDEIAAARFDIRRDNKTTGDIELTTLNLNSLRSFYHKAVFSPDLKTVVAIYGGNMFRELAFARSGDATWTALGVCCKEEFCDVVFYKGRVYAVVLTGTVAVFDLDGDDRLDVAVFMSPRGPLKYVHHGYPRILVESPDGDELFLLLREFKYDSEDFGRPFTANFKVFKLDETTFEWKRVDSLGEMALFVGPNFSMALSIREFPELRRNCIYFTADYSRPPDKLQGSFIVTFEFFFSVPPERGSDAGIFNLEDGSIVPLSIGEEDLRRISPPPILFTPNLCD